MGNTTSKDDSKLVGKSHFLITLIKKKYLTFEIDKLSNSKHNYDKHLNDFYNVH